MDFIIIPVKKHMGLEFMHIYNGLIAVGHSDLAKFYFDLVTVAENISSDKPYVEIDSSVFEKINSSEVGSKGDIYE